MSRLMTLRARVRGIDCGTIWVCQCCMLSHANGECCPDDRHGGDGIPPWDDLDPRYRVTMGMLASEHADGCEVRATGEWPDSYECDCERTDFSRSRCEGCGSWLAGERHAFGLWREPQRFYSGYRATFREPVLNETIRRVSGTGHWPGTAYVTFHTYGEQVHRSEQDARRWNEAQR